MFLLLSSCLVGVVLLIVLILANLLISEGSNSGITREELTSYECGFEHNSSSRVPFSLRYFLLTIVFLVFDMEIIFLLLVPYSLFTFSSLICVFVVFTFIVILVLGLFFEWYDGSLEWVM